MKGLLWVSEILKRMQNDKRTSTDHWENKRGIGCKGRVSSACWPVIPTVSCIFVSDKLNNPYLEAIRNDWPYNFCTKCMRVFNSMTRCTLYFQIRPDPNSGKSRGLCFHFSWFCILYMIYEIDHANNNVSVFIIVKSILKFSKRLSFFDFQ